MRNRYKRLILAGLALAPLGLAGCDELDPLYRSYYWHATNINRSNIAAMVANPNDLIVGRGAPRYGAIEDQIAVDTLLTGKQKPLLVNYGVASGGGGG